VGHRAVLGQVSVGWTSLHTPQSCLPPPAPSLQACLPTPVIAQHGAASLYRLGADCHPPLCSACLLFFFFPTHSRFSKFLRQILVFWDFLKNFSVFWDKFQELVIN